MSRGQLPETGDVVNAVVTKVIRSFALVEFTHYGEIYLGQIYISEFKKLGHGYIPRLSDIVQEGTEYRASVLEHIDKYGRWNLQLLVDEEG